MEEIILEIEKPNVLFVRCVNLRERTHSSAAVPNSFPGSFSREEERGPRERLRGCMCPVIARGMAGTVRLLQHDGL